MRQSLKPSAGVADKDQLLGYSRQVMDAVYELITEDEKNLIPVESLYSLSLEIEGEQIQDLPWGSAFAHFLHAPVLLESLRINLKLPIGALYEKAVSVNALAMQNALSVAQDYLKVNPAFFTYRFGVEEGEQVAVGIQKLQALLEKANTAGKFFRMNTHEVVTYKHERIETNEKHFVIEPANPTG